MNYVTVFLQPFIRDASKLQEFTDQVQAWCKANIGESYQEWMYDYQGGGPAERLVFISEHKEIAEQNAILFKLSFAQV
jgi:hypothetical protein